MEIHIIGLGSTAKEWNGEGYSIGLNDAWSVHKTDALVVANLPGKFPQDRLEIIKNSKPVELYSPIQAWRTYHPNMHDIKIRSWDGHLHKNTVIHTDSSASIAMDLARHLGATEIILWGVDFNNHKVLTLENPHTQTEIRQLKAITDKFKEVGVNVYLGAKGSQLESFLPIWG